jgi:DNA-binding transcriptional LysR family regulator
MSTTGPVDERVMRRLKLRELRILTTVAQAGSMGKAAAKLAISQPAVSKAVGEMEHTLGVALLDRTAQGVEPTLYGRALLKWATAVFDDLRQGVREIEFLADPTGGEVRVGCSEMMNTGLLPAVIDRMSRQYPRLVFSVMQASTIAAQYRDLRERRVDFVFGRVMTPIEDEDMNAEILFEDPLIVVAGTGSKWLRRRKIDAAELIGEQWCFAPYDLAPIGPFIAQAFRARGLGVPRLTVMSNSPHLYYAMVHTGRFLSLAPASTLRLSGKRLGLKALPVDIPIQSAPRGIVTLKNRTISPAAQLFIECARELAKPSAKRRSHKIVTPSSWPNPEAAPGATGRSGRWG